MALERHHSGSVVVISGASSVACAGGVIIGDRGAGEFETGRRLISSLLRLFLSGRCGNWSVSTISHFIQVPRGTRARSRFLRARSTHQGIRQAIQSIFFDPIEFRLHLRRSVGATVLRWRRFIAGGKEFIRDRSKVVRLELDPSRIGYPV